jgi:hypothetical protein
LSSSGGAAVVRFTPRSDEPKLPHALPAEFA